MCNLLYILQTVMFYFDIFPGNDGHNGYVIIYLLAAMVTFFFLKNIFYQLIIIALTITSLFFIFTEQYLYGALPGILIGSVMGILIIYITRVSRKQPCKLLYRYCLQIVMLVIVFFSIDLHEVIEETGFKTGLMVLYIAFTLLWFLFYFLNRQTEELVCDTWRNIQEYDDGYLCVFLISSAYILAPFVVTAIAEEILVMIVSVFAVAFLIYFFIHLHKEAVNL